MKSSLSLLLLVFTLSLFAQTNFEGKITYKMEMDSNVEKKILAEVFLKGNQMLLTGKDENKNKPLHYLYDFAKGISYDLGMDDSAAIITKLTRSPFSEKPKTGIETISILNYKALKTDYYIDSPMNIAFKCIESWFSKELIFKIPDSTGIQPPIVFFNDSSISLKVKLNFNNVFGGDPPLTGITIIASEIKREALNDSIFEIPAFRKVISMEDYLTNLIGKFKPLNPDLLDKKTGKLKIIGDPEMKEINKGAPPPPPPANPPKNKKTIKPGS